jgi:hypothetical protein
LLPSSFNLPPTKPMTPTDQQLKQALAKLADEYVSPIRNTVSEETEYWWKGHGRAGPVKDTELLHLCWLVEATLTKQWHNYVVALAKVIARAESNEKVSVPTNVLINSSWQQRTIALCKVKGIEIV